MDEKLAANVRATNRANAAANGIAPKLAEIFGPYVGQKILKADGTLLEKIRKQLPELPSSPGMRAHVGTGYGYSLICSVKAGEPINGNGSWLYHDTNVYVGNLRDGVLTELLAYSPRRTDYDAREIEAKREACRAARKTFESAQSALEHFGEY